jgi:tetratricopeptide (TPR) repeat protein
MAKPLDPRGLFDKGMKYVDTDKPDKALKEFRKAIEIDRDFAPGYQGIGTAYLQKRDVKKAVEYYKKAIEVDPEYPEAHFSLAMMYFQQIKLDEAISELNETLRLKPDFAEAYMQVGDIYMNKEDYPRAEAAYREAIRIETDDADAHYRLGLALHSQEYFDEAIEEVKRSLELDPDNQDIRNTMEDFLNPERLVEPDDWEDEDGWDAFLEGPDSPDEDEDYERTIKASKMALELDPGDMAALGRLAVALAETGEADEAMKMLTDAIAANPGNAGLHVALGNVFAGLFKTDEAIAEYDKALEIDPDDIDTRLFLGSAYLDDTRFVDAEQVFMEVLRRDPENDEACDNIEFVRALKSLPQPASELRNDIEIGLPVDLPPDVMAKVTELKAMTRAFCDEHLDDEYRWLAEKLIEKMTSEKDVSFLRGRPEIWAAGVIYALGQINNLFLKGASPRATPDDICGHFNVKRMTVVQKAAKIREMYGMRHFDDEFSRNPLWELIYSRSS